MSVYTGRSITSGHIKRILESLFYRWGLPTCIKSDIGPEFIAKEIQTWLKKTGDRTRFIDPGSPWQNGHKKALMEFLEMVAWTDGFFVQSRKQEE